MLVPLLVGMLLLLVAYRLGRRLAREESRLAARRAATLAEHLKKLEQASLILTGAQPPAKVVPSVSVALEIPVQAQQVHSEMRGAPAQPADCGPLRLPEKYARA